MYFRRPYQLSDGTRSRAPFDQASVVIHSYVFIRKKPCKRTENYVIAGLRIAKTLIALLYDEPQ